MGLYDRNYYRDEEQSPWSGGGRTMVVTLIVINVVCYIATLLFDQRLLEFASLKADFFQHPWQVWELVSYGFVHDPNDLTHILFNMFCLWLFGTDVESTYGRAEFLRIYLSSIIVAGLVWVIVSAASGGPQNGILMGASGGIMALMIIFVLHFPKRIFYIWGILPVPAWALGAMYVAVDVFGLGNSNDHVAHVAHLAGMGYGALYRQSGINLGRLIPQVRSGSLFRFRPKLRIHDPADDGRELGKRVDDILDKITRQGEASLTKQERKTLEEASRRYQRRRE